MLGVRVGCGASDQSFFQAEGSIYKTFFYSSDAFCHWNVLEKKEKGGMS